MMTNTCVAVVGSVLGLSGRTSCVLRHGWYTARMRPQHTKLLMTATGSATANHASQEGGLPSMDMRSMAKMFWGDEIGEVIPPMLEARAMPMTRDLAKGVLTSMVRRIGCTREKHSTGAATLEIHMDAKVATNMEASSTLRGLRPTRDSTATASCFAIKCLDSAAAMEKPPSSSMMVCENMAWKMAGAACGGVMRCGDAGLVRSTSTRSTTTSTGTSMAVANRGTASVAHSMDANTSSARQLFFSGSSKKSCDSTSANTSTHSDSASMSRWRTYQGMRLAAAVASTVAATVRRSSATMSRHTVLRSTLMWSRRFLDSASFARLLSPPLYSTEYRSTRRSRWRCSSSFFLEGYLASTSGQ
mmetsp:Transcript_21687/g.55213  ORF Transcript_21687/g.55213 Transcript_21687/m.55213 type:complete len:359 (-) Transcript_21687:980-2056(-)